MHDTILYSCPYIPAEWIAAHQLRPRRLQPAAITGIPAGSCTAGMCPYAFAFVRQAAADSHAQAVIFSTLCDQMRRAAEYFTRQSATQTFLLNVPSTSTNSAAGLYRSELARLGRFLEDIGGVAPTPAIITSVMQRYAAGRAAQVTPPLAPDAIPLMLLGAPLPQDASALLACIERAGGTVLVDATETGELSRPAPYDAFAADPLTELTRAYFETIPHAARRPDTPLYSWLAAKIHAYPLRGIIFLRYPWCDLWLAQVQRLKEWTSLPVLDLELHTEEGLLTRSVTRIEAFLEMLR